MKQSAEERMSQESTLEMPTKTEQHENLVTTITTSSVTNQSHKCSRTRRKLGWRWSWVLPLAASIILNFTSFIQAVPSGPIHSNFPLLRQTLPSSTTLHYRRPSKNTYTVDRRSGGSLMAQHGISKVELQKIHLT